MVVIGNYQICPEGVLDMISQQISYRNSTVSHSTTVRFLFALYIFNRVSKMIKKK